MSALDRLIERLARATPRRVTDSGRPEAAVALLLVRDPDRLMLIRRADRVGDPWSGHLALPGGRRSAGDADLIETAIRETVEEIAIPLERSWCVAQLDDLLPVTPVLPPILVRPFVFKLPAATRAEPGHEVAEAAWVELARLAAPGTYRAATLDIHGVRRKVPGYHLKEGILWGMTERILTPVLDAWRSDS